ncbi:MAG: EamA family transporter [Melioribacteraceae bacterium]
MTWFFIALIGTFLYACTNHLDKILLEKYFKGGIGALFICSAILSVLPLPFLFLIDSSVFDVGLVNILVLVAVGIFHLLVLLFYLIALKYDETSIVIVFYQLVPVFAYILGYFILGETLTKFQLMAMALIILGTTIISFEIDTDNKFKLRKKVILPMLAATFFWAAGGTVFKMVALEENVVRSLFWEHLTLAVAGIAVFIFIRSYRENFLLAVKNSSKTILSVNLLNEVLYMSGNIIFSFVYIMAPVSLVLLTDSFQPIFVLAIGIFLTIFFKKITVEKIQAKHLWQKIFAIAVTGIGTYLLFIA